MMLEFAQFANALTEAALLVSGDGTILGANRKAASYLKTEPSKLDGIKLFDLVTQEESALIDYLRLCARSSEPTMGSLVFKVQDEKISMRSEGGTISPRNGNMPAQILLRLFPRETHLKQFQILNEKIGDLSKQIVKRRVVESQLREQHERYYVTLSSIGDAVIATDASGNVTFLNAIAERLTGWLHNEAIGHPIEEVFYIINERTRAKVESPVEKVLKLGDIVGLANHTVLISKDGTEYAIDDSGSPIRDKAGNIIGVVLVFRDVTQQKALDTAKARLAAIVESTDDAVIGESLEGAITDWNTGAQKMYGYTREEAIGQHISILTPERLLPELTALLERIGSGERIPNYETIRKKKDGTEITVSITISPIYDSEGNLIGGAKIAKDITQQKRIEEELERYRKRLEQLVAKQTEELRELARHLLSVREDEKAKIAREVHDELGGTLTALKMDAVWVARALEPDHWVLRDKINAMTTLIDSAVAATRKIQTDLRPSVLDNLGLIAAIRWYAEEFSKHSHIMCSIDIADETQFHFDDVQTTALYRIVQESLSNIARHANATQATIRLEVMNSFFLMEIKDNGIGIDDAWRNDPSRHGIRGIRERVLGLGGTLELNGVPNQGTVLRVIIPHD